MEATHEVYITLEIRRLVWDDVGTKGWPGLTLNSDGTKMKLWEAE